MLESTFETAYGRGESHPSLIATEAMPGRLALVFSAGVMGPGDHILWAYPNATMSNPGQDIVIHLGLGEGDVLVPEDVANPLGFINITNPPLGTYPVKVCVTKFAGGALREPAGHVEVEINVTISG